MTTLTVHDLTQASLEGTGVFDVLMRANKAHLDAEFSKNRIKGPEYSTVYLGALQSVMQTALQFLLQRDRNVLEAQLLEQQILIAQQGVLKAQAEVRLINAQIAKLEREDALTAQQILNLQAEVLNVPKQGVLLEAQTNKTLKDVDLLDQQVTNLVTEELRIDAQTAQIQQQTSNAVIEADVLRGQKCKLDAEFDVLLQTKLKTASEVSLLAQKTQTEKAQTMAIGVDVDSVIGRQKMLYAAQTSGFERDAEQKTAKLMIDSWNVRRTTDEGTVADGTNMLYDPAVGRAVNKLLSGVNA